MPTRVQHVLFDADGVIQDVPGGWYAAMAEYVGARSREFLHRTWKDELPMLRGVGDYMPLLENLLVEYGVTHAVEDVFADVWHRINVDPNSVRLVNALRDQGFEVHLGTNQEQHRGAFMRANLGYETLFDVHCYSYELGVAKPDPRFFEEAARRIGAEPAAILFIDDSARNVEAARAVGLHAIHWDLTQGHDMLAASLSAYGFDHF